MVDYLQHKRTYTFFVSTHYIFFTFVFLHKHVHKHVFIFDNVRKLKKKILVELNQIYCLYNNFHFALFKNFSLTSWLFRTIIQPSEQWSGRWNIRSAAWVALNFYKAESHTGYNECKIFNYIYTKMVVWLQKINNSMNGKQWLRYQYSYSIFNAVTI